jgi:hypothetical protein
MMAGWPCDLNSNLALSADVGGRRSSGNKFYLVVNYSYHVGLSLK